MKIVKALVWFVALALLANVATVAVLPQLINRYVMHRIASEGVKSAQAATDPRPGARERVANIIGRRGYNVALPAPRADTSARTVVRPSPDLLYTVCVFDVSERPLHITAPVQDSYVSISGFALDTSNFFAINDAGVEPDADGRKRFDVVLAKAGAQNMPTGARVVTAPSDRGLILFRSLITSEATLSEIRTFQERQECDPV